MRYDEIRNFFFGWRSKIWVVSAVRRCQDFCLAKPFYDKASSSLECFVTACVFHEIATKLHASMIIAI